MDSAPQLKDGHSRGCYIMWACCGGLNMFTHSLQFLPPRHRVYFPNPWTWTDHVTGFAQKNTLNAAPRDFRARPQKKVFLEDLSLLASPLVLFGCSHHHVKELHPAHWGWEACGREAGCPGWPPQAAAKCEWGHLGWTSPELTCRHHKGRDLPSQLYPNFTVTPGPDNGNQDQINGWLFWTTKSWGRVGSSPGEGIGYPLQYSWNSLVGSVDKESACNVGDPGLIPGLGRSSGEGNGNKLQYSCLGNTMDRGDWWAIVHGVEKSQTRLSDQVCSAQHKR